MAAGDNEQLRIEQCVSYEFQTRSQYAASMNTGASLFGTHARSFNHAPATSSAARRRDTAKLYPSGIAPLDLPRSGLRN